MKDFATTLLGYWIIRMLMQIPIICNSNSYLLSICNIFFNECSAHTQWTSSPIITLPKKGKPKLITHWRGICLMSLANKLYNHIVLNPIRTPIDAVPRKSQAGLSRTGRSCILQIPYFFGLSRRGWTSLTTYFLWILVLEDSNRWAAPNLNN